MEVGCGDGRYAVAKDATACGCKCHVVLRESADEIERLRAALDERAAKAAFVATFGGVVCP
jgi:molybdopterin biosynthesis enzyme